MSAYIVTAPPHLFPRARVLRALCSRIRAHVSRLQYASNDCRSCKHVLASARPLAINQYAVEAAWPSATPLRSSYLTSGHSAGATLLIELLNPKSRWYTLLL